MTTQDDWELFVRGESEEALQAFWGAHHRSPSVGSLSNCGLALMDLGRYEEAMSVFAQVRDFEVAQGITSESTLVLLGICQWCAGSKPGAVDTWEQSLGTAYADAAGGVEGAAMLWFGATRTHDRPRELRAEKILRKLWKPRLLQATAWPGPAAIAGFLIGAVDEHVLVHIWTQDQPMLEVRRQCKARFWAGVRQGNHRDSGKYLELACSDRRAILEPEFFVAKWALRDLGTRVPE